MEPLAFIADLAADLARVHSAQRVVEVLFAALSERAAAEEIVVWYAPAGGHGRETSCSARGTRMIAGASPSTPGADARVVRLLDDGGHIVVRAPRSAAADLDDDSLRAVAAIVTSALRHVEIVDRVARLSRRAHVEARELRRRLVDIERTDGLVAASASMRRLTREVIPAVARHDTTVLLLGETGTGKEVLARRIHALSRRHGRAFVQINCGAIPPTLIESTLFGHERGSFTGALARHIGVFERAHQGTLLLDEIGDLPPAAQVKLLRVLQSGEIERVGGDRTVSVDVRVIAATNRALESMVVAGTFREDLYYRVSVFPIQLPPLRERPEDVDALTTAFVARAAARLGIEPPPVPDAVRRKLRRHTWPGNVRELENVIERALVLGAGAELRIAFPLAPAIDVRAPAVERLDTAMKRAIERALAASNHRIYGPGGAAALLGLKPSTLQSKMKKLGIARDSS